MQNDIEKIQDLILIGLNGSDRGGKGHKFSHPGLRGSTARAVLTEMKNWCGEAITETQRQRLVQICESLPIQNVEPFPSTDPKHPMHEYRMAILKTPIQKPKE